MAKVKDKWARITIDRESLARLKVLANGKPVAAYLRELSLEPERQERESQIEAGLARIEKKLGSKQGVPQAGPEMLRSLFDDITPETLDDFIQTMFEDIDARDWSPEDKKKEKRYWMETLAIIASVSAEQKLKLYQKIDADNGVGGTPNQG